MKRIFSYTLLALAALLAFVHAKSQVSAPVANNTSSTEPCGNPDPSKTPPCTSCGDDDETVQPNASEGSSCETNSIFSFNGNAHRVITDLTISGSVGNMPLAFKRYANSRLSSRNIIQTAFGNESPWSHNYEWMLTDDGGTVTNPTVKVTYPDGNKRKFTRPTATATIWDPEGSLQRTDSLVVTGDDYVLHTGAHEKFHFKRRYHSVTGGVFYRIESLEDSVGNIYTVSYQDVDDTLIRQITDPAGNWIKLHYDDLAVRSNASTELGFKLIPNSALNKWHEITVTPGEAYRYLALYQGNSWRQKVPMKVAELEFYDENNVQISGTAFGSSPWESAHPPADAMDGDTSTYYRYEYEKAGYVGIDLGAGNTSQVSRIRFRVNGGGINNDASVTFVGMNNEPVPNYVIAEVEGSDGRQVGYDYNIYSDPTGDFEWARLESATYTDLAESQYTYEQVHDLTMPLIKTAHDPRYSGKVRQVRYGYDPDTAIGFVVDEYDDASGQLLVSVRWDGGRKPKLVYPNGKVNLFIFSKSQKLVERKVDSFGSTTDYTYDANGFLITSDDEIGRTTTYTRDSVGRPLSMTSPAGSVTTYTRDAEGYLTALDQDGKTTTHTLDPTTKQRLRTDYADGTYETWTYNTFGQRLTHRLRNATTESWVYDAAGLLTQHTDPAGMVTDYTYNALNRLATRTRNLDGSTAYTTSYEYNDRGQVTKMTHPDGSFVQNIYDTYGYRIASMSERGVTTFYTYDSLGRMLTMTDPNGNVTAYDYTDALGGGCGCNVQAKPITITYPDGTVTRNSYDKEWRLLSTTVAEGTPQEATTSYTYDNAGQRTSMTDPLGRVTNYTYDLDGRVISETRAAGTALAFTTTRTYAVDGNLLSTTQAAGSPVALTTTMTYDVMDRMVSTTAASGTPAAQTTSRSYNSLGQMDTTTDALGRVTTYAYDAAGRQTDTILPDGTTMRSVYDAFGRTTQSIAAVGLAEEAITSMVYDNRDRVISQTDPTGVTTTTTYDGGGLPLTVTSPTGKSVEIVYDNNGNRTQTILAPGTAEQTTTTVAYDNRDRVITSTDGEGSVTTMTYDPLGRTLSVTDALSNTTSFTYDLIGRQLTTTAADNLVTSTITYDELDRVTSQKDGKNQTITYQYDALGRRTAYTDAKGATFSFQFDALGRLTKRTEPDASFQTYTYDVAGRLLVHTKADGQTKTNHYANTNRDFLTSITYSNGETARTMSYDALGRLLTANNANSAITRTYDVAGRQLSETQALTSGPSGTFTYTYDTDGNLSSHTRPDGSVVDYTWNARNLLAAVTSDGPPPVATYAYNGRNQIASTVVENGVFTATRTYDAAGRLTGVNNGTLDTTAYTLSADGRRTSITRNGDTENFGYDNARQVTSATYGTLATTQNWTYDAAGNRQTAVTNGLTTSYIANMVNEYTNITGAPAAPLYDNNGNALVYPVRPVGSASVVNGTFTWNINNELITATNGNGDSATYQYDALGRRTKRVETISSVATTTWFFMNAWNVELEHDGTNYTKAMTWGLDVSQSLQGAGGVGGLVMVEDLTGATTVAYFPTYDGNGNITAWVDGSGTIVATQRYDAYGNIIAQTGTAPSNYGFSTKPQEAVTGLLYYGYRYYDPETGRWLNRDPIEELGGINTYAFIANDGIGRTDFMGLSPISRIFNIRGTINYNAEGVIASKTWNDRWGKGASILKLHATEAHVLDFKFFATCDETDNLTVMRGGRDQQLINFYQTEEIWVNQAKTFLGRHLAPEGGRDFHFVKPGKASYSQVIGSNYSFTYKGVNRAVLQVSGEVDGPARLDRVNSTGAAAIIGSYVSALPWVGPLIGSFTTTGPLPRPILEKATFDGQMEICCKDGSVVVTEPLEYNSSGTNPPFYNTWVREN